MILVVTYRTRPTSQHPSPMVIQHWWGVQTYNDGPYDVQAPGDRQHSPMRMILQRLPDTEQAGHHQDLADVYRHQTRLGLEHYSVIKTDGSKKTITVSIRSAGKPLVSP